ncbi:MAG: glycosidase [Armatimonadota bacterium]|nr:glycosidase [Armatimonadota bacterium]MDR7443971.1 glycosidase [Armatimonadota bacterium]MDR7570069.1 glycosidase [Armatimonadota bacterium]MDR7615426.1 glycosidase [Armatimonadota bacterium]
MDIFRRYEGNPILRASDLPVPALGVYNPGVAEVEGEVVLLLRVEGTDGRSSLHVARSPDGIGSWRVDPEPLLSPDGGDERYEALGCEDPRVTFVEELGEWVIAYVAVGPSGPAVALATTRDFRSVRRLGLVLPPPNKDAALFPRRIRGRWWLLHRPSSGGAEHIWVAESPDLAFWGRPQLVLPERGGTWWDGARVGAGAVPVETPEGWLVIYHGVKVVAGVPNYRLGVALLDLENPARVTSRCAHPVLSPEAPYERVGNGFNIVFTCGALAREGMVWLYYGAADSCVALARARLADLVEQALACPVED